MRNLLSFLALIIWCCGIKIQSVYPTKGIAGSSTIIVTLIDPEYCAINCFIDLIPIQCIATAANITITYYFSESNDYSILVTCNHTYKAQFQYSVLPYAPITTPKVEKRKLIKQ
jgi:hypothetical protein